MNFSLSAMIIFFESYELDLKCVECFIIFAPNFTGMKKMSFAVAAIITVIALMSAAAGNEYIDIKTRAALGKKLFSEKILSKDSSVSCASCHKPGFAFADTVAFSVGIEGKLRKRG